MLLLPSVTSQTLLFREFEKCVEHLQIFQLLLEMLNPSPLYWISMLYSWAVVVIKFMFYGSNSGERVPILFVPTSRFPHSQILQQHISGRAGESLCSRDFPKSEQQNQTQIRQKMKKETGNYLQRYYKMYLRSDFVTNTRAVGTHHGILLCPGSPGSRVRQEFLPGIQIHGTVHELGTSLPWQGVQQLAHSLLQTQKQHSGVSARHRSQTLRFSYCASQGSIGRNTSPRILDFPLPLMLGAGILYHSSLCFSSMEWSWERHP